MRRAIVLLTLAVVSAVGLGAPAPAFEVASIKQNRSGRSSTALNILPDGRFRADNATVRDLIRGAYGFEAPVEVLVIERVERPTEN